MSKTDLIDTILTFVPATRGLNDAARKNLSHLPEERLSSLAAEIGRAADIAKKILAEEGVSSKAAEAALAKGVTRIREARTHFAEANKRLKERQSRQVANFHHGWETTFAPVAEVVGTPFQLGEFSQEILESSFTKFRSTLVECLVDINRYLSQSSDFSEQFRQFAQQATGTKFIEQLLRVRTTSMLLESWDLLFEPRRQIDDPEALLLQASFESIVKRARNEIMHRPSIYDPHLLSDYEDVVVETRAIDGLALLATRLIDYRPDLLVSLDRGGQIVGKLLQAEFGQEVGFYHQSITRQFGWRLKQTTKDLPTKIIIVDDIARSGDAISEVFGLVSSQYPGAEVRAMVIVSTEDAKQRLGEDILYTPNLALNLGVRVPWKNHGDAKFRQLKDFYVLGEADNTFKVSRDMLGRMVRRYQAALQR